MKSAIIISITIVIMLAVAHFAESSFTTISDEELVDLSDIIVVGKITKITGGRFSAKRKEIATITVVEVIKGEKDLKKVKFAFPSRKRGRKTSTDIFYEKGQEGIWLLRKPEKGKYHLADSTGRLQSVKKLDKIKAIVEKEESQRSSGLDRWKKNIIDQWIIDNDLNRYGDPKGTAYMGGTPLFDEKTGRHIDRYEYIYLRHPEVRKLLIDKSKKPQLPVKQPQISDDMRRKIDSRIEENSLNRYGDPKDTMYIGGTPRFDESTGKTTDRYEYILRNHPGLRKELGL